MTELLSNSSCIRLHWIRIGFYLVAAIILVTLGTGSFGRGEALFLRVGSHWHFFLIGILAATVANSTGAGGGIVFLPVFTVLGLTVTESLATSFAIQCFGMTAGALTWLLHLKRDAVCDAQTSGFLRIFLVSACGSLLGLRLAQEFLPDPGVKIEWFFSFFSLAVGLLILRRTFVLGTVNGGRDREASSRELAGVAVTTFIGGAITAWLSVGVGEILAIHLLALRYRVNVAVAAAVCVTSITVITAVPYYLTEQAIVKEVLVFAAPGALIGGTLAKRFAILLGAKRLKLGMAGWIILTAIVYLIV
ncbi:MAG: putative membrane protein YfcA [Akkermansiaceae bacterium]|jgi:uncharacterized membrane protein YfcA